MLLLLSALGSRAAHAQPGFCLRDANGDGHPLFGNPEVMLNPFVDLQELLYMTPVSAAVGDLDRDGDIDAVATYAQWNLSFGPETDVSIILNRGDGTFFNAAVYDCGDYPTSVAIGDLDGDGLNDLAITNRTSGQVSVLINASAATFPTRVSYPVQARPCSVVITDLNGDGHNDLAVANAQTDSVSILLNNGDGTFGPATNYWPYFIPDIGGFFGDPYAFGGHRT
jgi:hypothetical protein